MGLQTGMWGLPYSGQGIGGFSPFQTQSAQPLHQLLQTLQSLPYQLQQLQQLLQIVPAQLQQIQQIVQQLAQQIPSAQSQQQPFGQLPWAMVPQAGSGAYGNPFHTGFGTFGQPGQVM
jgi:hypothetical protein